jgi:putative ABC transport system permease protein
MMFGVPPSGGKFLVAWFFRLKAVLQTGATVKPHLWLIKFIGIIVPRRLRASWRQEWEAELEYRESLLADWDKLDWRNKLALLWHSLGALMDALWLQPRRWEDEMIQDFRFGARMLLKNKGFTAVAALSLALGIGATTAMFSFVDAVLLKPLAYRDPERLVMVMETRRMMPSAATFLAWREHQQIFSQLAIFTASTDFNLTGGDRAESVRAVFVSANYFEMLGVQPSLGRAFREDEDQSGKERVVVLSHKFWQRRTGKDTDIIGRTLTLNGESYTVIGILPGGGVFDRETTDIWLPLVFKPAELNRQIGTAMARIKPGITLEQANVELKLLSERLEAQGVIRIEGRTAFAQPLREHLVGTDMRRILLLLLGAMGFILLIACANVANLLLARGAARRAEFAIRAALGAGRLRLLRQLLTESLLLAVLGGAAGAVMAVWLIKAFIAFMPRFTLPVEAEVTLDYRTLCFALAVSLLTGVLFGMAPAWQASRLDLSRPLQERSAGASGRNKPGRLLLVAQLALTCVLVIGATLMIRSLSRLLAVDPGFQPERLLTLHTNLDTKRYPTGSQLIDYQTRFIDGLRSLPGVQSAAASNGMPFGERHSWTFIRIPGREPGEAESVEGVLIHTVSPDYFQTLGGSLLRGRFLSELDTEQAAPAIVINQTLANRHWREREPLGGQIFFRLGRFTQIPFTVVGVVADLKIGGLNQRVSQPEIYLSLTQMPKEMLAKQYGRSLQFIVRTRMEPGSLTGAVQSLAASIDKEQPIDRLRTMERAISDSVAAPRFRATLFGIFAAFALILAAVGIYGVMAYAVEQRTKEIGIRVALGARRGEVLKLVLGQGLRLTCAGLVVGLAASFGLTRYLTSFLFEMKSADGVTYLAVSTLLAFVAIAACYVPARRALRVNPVVALREE